MCGGCEYVCKGVCVSRGISASDDRGTTGNRRIRVVFGVWWLRWRFDPCHEVEKVKYHIFYRPRPKKWDILFIEY